MRRLARLHDAITRAGFVLAGIALATIALAYCYEVVARYFFGAPTDWASPLVSYAMAVTIFLAFPELSRNAAHITINVLTDAVSAKTSAYMTRISRGIAALACLLASWFCFNESLSQMTLDVWTNPPFAVPKWLISIFVPYGMLSSAIYFIRQIFVPTTAHGAAAEAVT